ncbi:MAG TPA: L-serine ammonia-lyase [Clostridiales bacterium]|nr:L-serine ammonia-lyase [Clostridiales bacterium]HQP69046.1 L-serine ammonia-lyase [Clostridiales bacterium]
MESIREIYRIGHGPSSSHTMGPRKAADIFRKRNPDTDSFRVTLYGSLAATGKGHQTDRTIIDAFMPAATEIIWKPEVSLEYHTNAVKFEALGSDGKSKSEWTVYSLGGGKITDLSAEFKDEDIYQLTTMDQILWYIKDTGKSFWEYVIETEGDSINDYLLEVWNIMQDSIARGIDSEGVIPGGLKLSRKASSFYVKSKDYTGSLKGKSRIFSYALAVAEENACGGKIVTAPTCGSCGVLPAVLKTMRDSFEFSDQKIIRALATAGLIGNIVKKNASISGAKVGCQGEIGTACAMASAAATQLLGGTPYQIEYAAEMGMEHHLGLTCDPINGLVQVPCIERNAFAAERALNTSTFAIISDGRHLVSFDKVVKTMNQTGHDLPSIYKETSEGGLAIH